MCCYKLIKITEMKNIIGMIVGLIAMTLAWIWFGWEFEKPKMKLSIRSTNVALAGNYRLTTIF